MSHNTTEAANVLGAETHQNPTDEEEDGEDLSLQEQG
jgi:hypothetical protein